MAVGAIMPTPVFTGWDDNGDPVAGGLLYTCVAGTVGTATPLATYSDSDLLIGHVNANPVVLDAAGRATVFLTPGSAYKFVLKTAAGTTIWTADDIIAGGTGTSTDPVTKVIAGNQMVVTSTGGVAGTGDVTVALAGTITTGIWDAEDVTITNGSLVVQSWAGGAAPNVLVFDVTYSTGTVRVVGDMGFAATKKIYLDGVSVSGDTYISESAANTLSLLSGGVEAKFTSGIFSVAGFGSHIFTAGGTGGNSLQVYNSTSGAANYAQLTATAGTSNLAMKAFSQGFTTSGPNIAASGMLFADGAGGLTLHASNAAGVIRFYTGYGATEVARFGLTGSLQVGGSAARSGTAGAKRIDIFDGTAPTGTLANGVSLYSAAGELVVMDAAGNATPLSPHDDDNKWVFRSKNTVTGECLHIDMEDLVSALEQVTGRTFAKRWVEPVKE